MNRPLDMASERKISPATRTVASALGWFSIALGLLEMVRPRATAGAPGMRSSALLRLYGLREAAVGVGLVTAEQKEPWLWGRVAGDALDLAALGGAPARPRTRTRTLVSLAAIAGITAIDWAAASTARREAELAVQGTRDYSDRSGFRATPDEMRGIARRAPGAARAAGPVETF